MIVSALHTVDCRWLIPSLGRQTREEMRCNAVDHHQQKHAFNHGCTIETGYSLFGGPPFIPMKVAQWRLMPKITDFPGIKIPGSDIALPLCLALSFSGPNNPDKNNRFLSLSVPGTVGPLALSYNTINLKAIIALR